MTKKLTGGWSRETSSEADLQRILLKLLDNVTLFAGFSQAELLDLLTRAEKCVFPASEVIIREGGFGHFMYIIMDGEVEIHKKLKNGSQKKLARFSSGNSFGEMALVDNEERSASVLSVTDCVLIRIGEKDFVRNPASSAKLFKNIARTLSRRLRDTNEMVSLLLLEQDQEQPQPEQDQQQEQQQGQAGA